ncbi:MAG: hypothetical protein LAT82_05920 [Nanoarchaeota archaeon]|nr:hypothetical protein [Nanoarchaeota archaeon]
MTSLSQIKSSQHTKNDLEQKITSISKQLIEQLSQSNGLFSCDSFGTLFTNSRRNEGKRLFEKIAQRAEELTTNSPKPIIYIPSDSISNQKEGIKRVIKRFKARDEDSIREKIKPWIDAMNNDFRAVYMTQEEFDEDDPIFNQKNYQGFSAKDTYLGPDYFTISTIFNQLRLKSEVQFHPVYDFSGLSKKRFMEQFYSTMLQWDGSALVDKHLIKSDDVLNYGGEYKIKDLLPQRQIEL